MKNWNWNRWMIGLTAALTLGCGSSDAPEELPALEQIQAGLYLEKAESCEDLETYLKDLHLESMKNMLMNGGYGYGGPVMGLAEPGMDIAASPRQEEWKKGVHSGRLQCSRSSKGHRPG